MDGLLRRRSSPGEVTCQRGAEALLDDGETVIESLATQTYGVVTVKVGVVAGK
jgi:hypothetical protein